MSTKTYMAKVGEVAAGWYLVDATDKVLGRMASRIATILRGKHRPVYTPHTDTGEFVIVVNAGKIKLTGNKLADKKYPWFTGYPGGLKHLTAEQMLAKHPTKMVELAVRRMLPQGPMGEKMYKKLKVYADGDHPHQAQQPKELKL